MPFEWIRTILTKHLGKDSDSKYPSFLQHLPQVSKVEHTIDRCRILIVMNLDSRSQDYPQLAIVV